MVELFGHIPKTAVVASVGVVLLVEVLPVVEVQFLEQNKVALLLLVELAPAVLRLPAVSRGRFAEVEVDSAVGAGRVQGVVDYFAWFPFAGPFVAALGFGVLLEFSAGTHMVRHDGQCVARIGSLPEVDVGYAASRGF